MQKGQILENPSGYLFEIELNKVNDIIQPTFFDFITINRHGLDS